LLDRVRHAHDAHQREHHREQAEEEIGGIIAVQDRVRGIGRIVITRNMFARRILLHDRFLAIITAG